MLVRGLRTKYGQVREENQENQENIGAHITAAQFVIRRQICYSTVHFLSLFVPFVCFSSQVGLAENRLGLLCVFPSNVAVK